MSRARGKARARLIVVRDERQLCGVCGDSRPGELGLCRRCQDAYVDLAVFDQQVERIRQGGRS